MEHLEVVSRLNIALMPGSSKRVFITFTREIRPGGLNYLIAISQEKILTQRDGYSHQVSLPADQIDILDQVNRTGIWKPETTQQFLLAFDEHQLIDTSKFALELAMFIENIAIV